MSEFVDKLTLEKQKAEELVSKSLELAESFRVNII
jgi:hypothetical protein